MEQKARRNLLISGIGAASGGIYDKVKIEGVGKVDGDIDCNDFALNGKCDVKGSVQAKLVEIYGTASVSQHVAAEKAVVRGKCGIKGGFSAEEAEIHGEVVAGQNCEAESFRARGSVSVDGLLNAGAVEITLYGNSRAKEIGGEIIHVKKGDGDLNIFQKMFFGFAPRLTAELIEGDEIYLEATKANVVRGNDVTIGPGCDIDRVEYKNTFHQNDGAKVKSHHRV